MKELEIEFRNLLTKEEYNQLVEQFHLKEEDFFEQTNYYFDTPDFLLRDHNSALRIRKRADYFELTLKTPEGDGLLETTQLLGADQAEAIFQGANIPTGQVREMLQTIGINHTDLKLFGSLSTIRAEKDYQDGLLVFDKNLYGNIVDYDLEYEVKKFRSGTSHFLEIIKKTSYY
ncbi:adenylate cyclase [Listeria floridensis FSL S10-1187]|uniref:Adenylate cyclase n=1 Tax=Listeria floridensis FSL S10-1187 TaxID=1265817 RepID=A0ABN0REZ0_9LIST|nr:adenylate cyclase [Listeria floridensis FSL S10-1187]